MLESISGTIERTAESALLIRTGPVLISVMAPGYFLRSVTPGRRIEIPVYLHLQMEGNRIVPLLVGFPDERDRSFFEKFISVSGVGVKAAVKALEQPPESIASAIATEDYDYLTTLPGIGRKRARQIVAGLQEQMKEVYGGVLPGASPGLSGQGPRNEARAVLRQLGVTPAEAERLLDSACGKLGEQPETAEIVKMAMRIRSGK